MSPIRYERNSAGLEELLLGEPMAAHMHELAVEGVVHLLTIAPQRSGRYKASARAEGGTDPFPTPRAVGHVIVDAEYAIEVEAKHHVLARVCDHLENR